MRVAFTLRMPGRGSWDGKWSAEERHYVLYRTIPKDRATALGVYPGSKRCFRYAFGDGWVAEVEMRGMLMGERKSGSDGFCGYDWMVEEILKHGRILTLEERYPAKSSGAGP